MNKVVPFVAPIVLLSQLGFGCKEQQSSIGKTNTSGATNGSQVALGRYNVVGTSAIGGGAADHEETCYSPQPVASSPGEVTLSASSLPNTVGVTLEPGGCFFEASVSGAKAEAQEVECELPAGGVLAKYGVSRRRMRVFSFDLSTGEVHQAFTDFRNTDVPYHNCATISGLIDGQPKGRSTTPSVVRFEGQQLRCTDQPALHAVEQCTESEWPTSGQLLVEAPNAEQRVITELGLGCVTTAQRTSDGTFTASKCVLDPEYGLIQFDVVDRNFDEFVFDEENRQLRYSVQELRLVAEEEFIRRYSTSITW